MLYIWLGSGITVPRAGGNWNVDRSSTSWQEMIVALIGFLLQVGCLIFPLVAIIGVFRGIKGLKSSREKFAITGLVLSVIGLTSLVFFVWFSVWYPSFPFREVEILPVEVTPIIPKNTPIIPKDETADWKTYRNEEYRLEFKYPPEWEFYKGSIEPHESVQYTSDTPEGEIIRWRGYDLFIKIQPNYKNIGIDTSYFYKIGLPDFTIRADDTEYLSLEEIFGKYIFPDLRTDIDHEIKNVKINNTDEISFIEIGMTGYQEYLILYKNKFFYISFCDENLTSLDTVSVFNQILSTFRFLE